MVYHPICLRDQSIQCKLCYCQFKVLYIAKQVSLPQGRLRCPQWSWMEREFAAYRSFGTYIITVEYSHLDF